MKAHPTTYAGTEFRSRLEATWAAFFDLMEWDWVYEPLDEPGWVPDFLIRGPDQSLYVEVKPIDSWGSCSRELQHTAQSVRQFSAIQSFMESSGKAVLILGLGPCHSVMKHKASLGALLAHKWPESASATLLVTHAYLVGLGRNAFDVSHGPDMIADKFGDTLLHGFELGWDTPILPYDGAAKLWRDAQNRTKWRGYAA